MRIMTEPYEPRQSVVPAVGWYSGALSKKPETLQQVLSYHSVTFEVEARLSKGTQRGKPRPLTYRGRSPRSWQPPQGPGKRALFACAVSSAGMPGDQRN
jgi:hypothetical protein